jgi:galactokinase
LSEQSFVALFGRAPTAVGEASGRVNLIGEHTDYNGGYVLPTAIPQWTRVELASRQDDLARVASADMGSPGEVVEYRVGAEQPRHGWIDYVQGVTRFLAEAGHRLRGFEARISSTVPIGSGLSSSAALEVSMMRALRDAFGLELDAVAMARIGQRAENEFVGAQTGIMDQMAASLADRGTALFLDTRSLDYQKVPLPGAAELVVLNSGVAHNHARGDYNTRRAECERAAELLGVEQLRDVPIDQLARVQALPEPLRRRARHVVTEDERVLVAVDAMRHDDVVRLGELFYQSHASMRDDYEVSVPEIDLIVDLARQDHDVFGARLTGGGFGGSVVMLARIGAGRAVAERVAGAYARESGQRPTVLVPGPA